MAKATASRYKGAAKKNTGKSEIWQCTPDEFLDNVTIFVNKGISKTDPDTCQLSFRHDGKSEMLRMISQPMPHGKDENTVTARDFSRLLWKYQLAEIINAIDKGKPVPENVIEAFRIDPEYNTETKWLKKTLEAKNAPSVKASRYKRGGTTTEKFSLSKIDRNLNHEVIEENLTVAEFNKRYGKLKYRKVPDTTLVGFHYSSPVLEESFCLVPSFHKKGEMMFEDGGQTSSPALREVRIIYDNGHVQETSMSASLSDDDIRKYYKVGREFNIGGTGGKDKMAKVKTVEILLERGGDIDPIGAARANAIHNIDYADVKKEAMEYAGAEWDNCNAQEKQEIIDSILMDREQAINFHFNKGGAIPDFLFTDFILRDLDAYMKYVSKDGRYGDIEVSKVSRNGTGELGTDFRKNHKLMFTKLSIGQAGKKINISRGNENMHVDFLVYDENDKEYTISLYSKDNHEGLKQIANEIIQQFEQGGSVDSQEEPNGFFSNDGKTYINLEVGKSSPNRTGEVIERTHATTADNKKIEIARVKFRDFESNVIIPADKMAKGGSTVDIQPTANRAVKIIKELIASGNFSQSDINGVSRMCAMELAHDTANGNNAKYKKLFPVLQEQIAEAARKQLGKDNDDKFVVISEKGGGYWVMSTPATEKEAKEFLALYGPDDIQDFKSRGETLSIMKVKDVRSLKHVNGLEYLDKVYIEKKAAGGNVSEKELGSWVDSFNGQHFVGEKGLDTIKEYSEKNKDSAYLVTDTQGFRTGPFILKNGHFDNKEWKNHVDLNKFNEEVRYKFRKISLSENYGDVVKITDDRPKFLGKINDELFFVSEIDEKPEKGNRGRIFNVDHYNTPADKTLYTDLKEWLSGKKNIDGKVYKKWDGSMEKSDNAPMYRNRKEAGGSVNTWMGGISVVGYGGPAGFDKIKALSKENPEKYYKFAVDNYTSDWGELMMKNGRVFKAEVKLGNPIRIDLNPVSFRPKKDDIYKFKEQEYKPVLESGGAVSDKVTVTMNGNTFYLTKIDGTHFFMSIESDKKGNPYHVGQFNSTEDKDFYNDAVKWLHGEMNISGKTYDKKYWKGGVIDMNTVYITQVFAEEVAFDLVEEKYGTEPIDDASVATYAMEMADYLMDRADAEYKKDNSVFKRKIGKGSEAGGATISSYMKMWGKEYMDTHEMKHVKIKKVEMVYEKGGRTYHLPTRTRGFTYEITVGKKYKVKNDIDTVNKKVSDNSILTIESVDKDMVKFVEIAMPINSRDLIFMPAQGEVYEKGGNLGKVIVDVYPKIGRRAAMLSDLQESIPVADIDIAISLAKQKSSDNKYVEVYEGEQENYVGYAQDGVFKYGVKYRKENNVEDKAYESGGRINKFFNGLRAKISGDKEGDVILRSKLGPEVAKFNSNESIYLYFRVYKYDDDSFAVGVKFIDYPEKYVQKVFSSQAEAEKDAKKRAEGGYFEQGGKVGGRGFFNLQKGPRITSMDQIKVGNLILVHSNQFNADNTLKVIGKRTVPVDRFDLVYWDPINNRRIGNEEMSLADFQLDSMGDEYYLVGSSRKFDSGGSVTGISKELADLYVKRGELTFTASALKKQMGGRALAGKSKAELEKVESELRSVESKIAQHEKKSTPVNAAVKTSNPFSDEDMSGVVVESKYANYLLGKIDAKHRELYPNENVKPALSKQYNRVLSDRNEARADSMLEGIYLSHFKDEEKQAAYYSMLNEFKSGTGGAFEKGGELSDEDKHLVDREKKRGFSVYQSYYKRKGTDEWTKHEILSSPDLTEKAAITSAQKQFIYDNSDKLEYPRQAKELYDWKVERLEHGGNIKDKKPMYKEFGQIQRSNGYTDDGLQVFEVNNPMIGVVFMTDKGLLFRSELAMEEYEKLYIKGKVPLYMGHKPAALKDKVIEYYVDRKEYRPAHAAAMTHFEDLNFFKEKGGLMESGGAVDAEPIEVGNSKDSFYFKRKYSDGKKISSWAKHQQAYYNACAKMLHQERMKDNPDGVLIDFLKAEKQENEPSEYIKEVIARNYESGGNLHTGNKVLNKQDIEELIAMDDDSRETYLSMMSKRGVLNFPESYKVIEKLKFEALRDRRTEEYEKLMAVKAHMEMWDDAFHKKGGKVHMGFEELSEKVADQYENKPVPPKYRPKYGSRYSKAEAKEVGDKVAGKIKYKK